MTDHIDKKIENMRYGVQSRMSKLEARYYSDHYLEMVLDDLRQRLANYIVHEKYERIDAEDFFDIRLDLYVATPAQFWKLVNEKAEALAERFHVPAIRP